VTGAQLRRLRLKRELTQLQLAERLGVRANTVARWERGELRITAITARLVQLLFGGVGGREKGS
jgi:transcriptional regulator with XRE-family HTH domain